MVSFKVAFHLHTAYSDVSVGHSTQISGPAGREQLCGSLLIYFAQCLFMLFLHIINAQIYCLAIPINDLIFSRPFFIAMLRVYSYFKD